MKLRVSLSLAVLLAFSTISFAQQPGETPLQPPPSKPSSDSGQEVKKVQEPEYYFVVFYLDPAGVLIPLERQKAKIATKVKAWGYGGMQTGAAYSGSQSPVRFRAGQDIQFVVRVPPPDSLGMEPLPPDAFIKLKALKVSKGDRMKDIQETKAMGLGYKAPGDTSRTLMFKKYGEQSLKVSPAEPLEPGEYVMTTTTGMLNGDFLFGIDPK
jgi:hypothetical protein